MLFELGVILPDDVVVNDHDHGVPCFFAFFPGLKLWLAALASFASWASRLKLYCCVGSPLWGCKARRWSERE